jgi:hypothetical protein
MFKDPEGTDANSSNNEVETIPLTQEIKHKLTNALSAVLIWESLLNKGDTQAPEKLKKARDNYRALCNDHSVDPKVK